jgi:hypothetical protein
LSYDDLKNDVMGYVDVTENSLLRNLMIIQCGNPSIRPALDDLTPITEESIPNCTLSDRIFVENMTYSMIVTKKPAGFVVDLNTFMEDPDITSLEKRATLAKTVIAITKMHEIRISHNDQHWGNILIVDETKYDDGGYRLDGHTYSLPTSFKPVLFDWDRSQVAGWKPNPVFLGFPDLYKPEYSTARDWFTFYKQILLWHEELFGVEGDANNETLAKCFFRTDSVSRLIPFWLRLTQKSFWTFSSKKNLRLLDVHTCVNQRALLKYLGFVPQIQVPSLCRK